MDCALLCIVLYHSGAPYHSWCTFVDFTEDTDLVLYGQAEFVKFKCLCWTWSPIYVYFFTSSLFHCLSTQIRWVYPVKFIYMFWEGKGAELHRISPIHLLLKWLRGPARFDAAESRLGMASLCGIVLSNLFILISENCENLCKLKQNLEIPKTSILDYWP